MSPKIFKTPPLGALSQKTATSKPPQNAESQRDEMGAAKKRATPSKVTEIPMPPEYRVVQLGRGASGLGASQIDKWQTQTMRSHRSPTFLWFTRGQGRITVSGVTRGFGPHNLIYLPRKTMYGYEPVGHVYGFEVHVPNDPALNLPEAPLHMRFLEAQQQNEVTGMIEGLQREINLDQPGRDRAMALQAGLLAVWLERQIEIMPEYDLTPDASRRLTAAFTAMVEQELGAGHNVAYFAAALGVTPTHLSRACNIASGRPASALLSDRVHFEARRMLAETDLPIRDIAQKLGFTSPAYFSRSFLKNVGQSPREFRKTH